MKIEAITLREIDNTESPNIATIVMRSDTDINSKIIEACESHFDEELIISKPLKQSEIIQQLRGGFGLKMIIQFADDKTADILLETTWLI